MASSTCEKSEAWPLLCGAPSAAAFMVEAAAEECSGRGARPSPEKTSCAWINTRACRRRRCGAGCRLLAGCLELGGRSLGAAAGGAQRRAGRLTGRENAGGTTGWQERKLWRSWPRPAPKAGEESNELAHGRRVHKHAALRCAMYSEDSRLIFPQSPSHRRVSQQPVTRKTVAVSAACQDRKSTRLNSSHMSISYAVFCLKNKIIVN